MHEVLGRVITRGQAKRTVHCLFSVVGEGGTVGIVLDHSDADIQNRRYRFVVLARASATNSSMYMNIQVCLH